MASAVHSLDNTGKSQSIQGSNVCQVQAQREALVGFVAEGGKWARMCSNVEHCLWALPGCDSGSAETHCERNNKTAYLLFGHAGIVLCEAMSCKAQRHWEVIVEQTFMGGVQLY